MAFSTLTRSSFAACVQPFIHDILARGSRVTPSGSLAFSDVSIKLILIVLENFKRRCEELGVCAVTTWEQSLNDSITLCVEINVLLEHPEGAHTCCVC